VCLVVDFIELTKFSKKAFTIATRTYRREITMKCTLLHFDATFRLLVFLFDHFAAGSQADFQLAFT
jgi:hypothetical protein